MIRHDAEDISDELFKTIVDPVSNVLREYIKANIINEFIAFDIATTYKMDAMWDQPLNIQIQSASNDLAELVYKEDCNKKEILNILKEKYKLIVVSESPIEIKEIKD